jgi:hypothetical protein
VEASSDCLGDAEAVSRSALFKCDCRYLNIPTCNKVVRPSPAYDRYLVDSASSHMLVSKIKPCKSKFK